MKLRSRINTPTLTKGVRNRKTESGRESWLQGMVAERKRERESAREAAIETVLRSLGSHRERGWLAELYRRI